MDRYYPREPDSVPHNRDWYNTTYDQFSDVQVKNRCPFPPGYSGHLHGVRDKIGYGSIATTRPMQTSRSDAMFDVQPRLRHNPPSLLNLKQAQRPASVSATTRSNRRNSGHTEDAKTLYFLSQNAGACTVEKDRPFTPSRPNSRGTGFDHCRPTVSWLSNAKIATDTTSKHYGFQNTSMRGLQYLQIQQRRNLHTRVLMNST